MCLSVMGSSIPFLMHLPGTIVTDPAVCEITSSYSKQNFIIGLQLCRGLQQVLLFMISCATVCVTFWMAQNSTVSMCVVFILIE